MAHAPVRKAVFPVGGLGTRFLPATKSLPKEMLPIVDKPLVHYAFDEARAAGIEQFIFITGRNKNAINNHFDHSYELQSKLDEQNKDRELEATRDWLPDPGNIIFIRQQQPLGLGHAVWCARNVIGDEPFAVLLADDIILSKTPCLKQLVDAYRQVGGNIIGAADIAREKTSSYGVFDIAKDEGRLVRAKGLVEKPKPEDAPSHTAVFGRYILQPSIFKYLDKQKAGVGGEIQLTDAIREAMGETPLTGFRFEGERFDCGHREGFVEANIAFALARPDMHDRMQAILKKYSGS